MDARTRWTGAPTLAACAGAAFFFVYACRLCPTLCLMGDSGELVTAAAVWGVPHPPGYPLFTTIAHAFTWLPLHAIAWRIHLTSAVFHAGAVAVAILATFSITRDRFAALAAGVALGLDRTFFLGSLYAEVFPLNDLLFALLLLAALRLRAGGTTPARFAGIAGLAAAHHMMIALAAPALLALVLPSLLAVRGVRRWLGLAVAFALPILLIYALVPLAAARDPAISWGDVHDARSLLALITRRDYGGLFSSVHGTGHGTGGERLIALAWVLRDGFGIAALLVAAGGAVVLLRRDRAAGAALLLAFVTTGPLFAWLNALATDTEEAAAFFARFFTMCTVPLALAFGAGVAALSTAIPPARSARVIGAVTFAAWMMGAFLRVRDVDLHGDERSLAFARDLVLRTPDRSLLLLSGDASLNGALYVCAVEHLCGERVTLAPGGLFLPWEMAQARRRHPDIDIPWTSGPALKRTHEIALAAARDRPVFVFPDLLHKDPLLEETLTPFPDHLLFRLWPRDADPALERAAFVESARAMAGATSSSGCDGCLLPLLSSHPTQEAQLAHAYEAAAFNHARVAGELAETRALVPALLARSGDYAQRGGESMSRKSSSSSR